MVCFRASADTDSPYILITAEIFGFSPFAEDISGKTGSSSPNSIATRVLSLIGLQLAPRKGLSRHYMILGMLLILKPLPEPVRTPASGLAILREPAMAYHHVKSLTSLFISDTDVLQANVNHIVTPAGVSRKALRVSSLTQVWRDETFDEGRDEEERQDDEDERADDVAGRARRLGRLSVGIGLKELERGRGCGLI